MPKSFNEKESQIQFLLMVCKMRGMTVKEIQAEIKLTLKIDISTNSLYNRLQKYEEINAKELQELKKSNHAYISRIMELVNHFRFYRKTILTTLNNPKNKQAITPALLYKATELLQKLDRTEFNMLERVPEIFSWKRGLSPSFSSNVHHDHNEKSIEEYVTSIEQIPIPSDFEDLQSKVEDENLV
jgi:maltooligosyltrehalose synthase